MPIRLFQNPTNPGYVFYGESEHDEIHRGFAHQVVVFQVMFDSLKCVKEIRMKGFRVCETINSFRLIGSFWNYPHPHGQNWHF